MSVQSEITRIQNAVNSAIAAIENKGVSVSDGAGVDDLAALIESIICPDVSVVTATAGNVLAGKVFVDANGNAVTGTMTNQGAVNTTVAAGETYTIPAGYHNGSGKVTGAASSGYQLKTGSVAPNTTEQSLTVNHGLGKKPVGVVLYRTDSAGVYIVRAEWINNTTYAQTNTKLIAAYATVTTSSVTLSLDAIGVFFYGNYNYAIWG